MSKRIYKASERGAVLATALVLLVVLTLLGILAMQSSTLQERMAGNLQQEDLAFEAAEAGLRDAEAWLNGTAVLPSFNGSNGLYPALTPDQLKALNWSSVARTYQGLSGAPAPNPTPTYIIERVDDCIDLNPNDSVKAGTQNLCDYNMYRITSRGTNASGTSMATLQTTFLR